MLHLTYPRYAPEFFKNFLCSYFILHRTDWKFGKEQQCKSNPDKSIKFPINIRGGTIFHKFATKIFPSTELKARNFS